MRGAQLEQIEELGEGHRKGDAPFLCFWILRIEGRFCNADGKISL